MSTKQISSESYNYFSNKEGNQHIAGMYALQKILDIIKVNKPKYILEVGLGIGSISYTILKDAEVNNRKLVYHGTESNEFCLKMLKENLSQYYNSIEIFNDIENLKSDIKYDFIIIDGTDQSIDKIKDSIAPNGVIFIEGGRAEQTQKMKTTFPDNKYTVCISDFKNPEWGPFPSDIWSGGGSLIYIKPTTKQFFHYLKERIRTAFRYKIKRKLV